MAHSTPQQIRAHLLAARDRVIALTRDLEPAQLLGPKLEIVNPPLWELGHLAWFQERWCLRLSADDTLADSMIENADRLYDSAIIPHAARWTAPLLGIEATRAYLDSVLERVLDRLRDEGDNPRVRYFSELVACHEDMHAEAFHYTRQTLGYVPPMLSPRPIEPAETTNIDGDAEFSGGAFMLGAYPEQGFVFDNEKWAHEVLVAPFRMARAPVTNHAYLAFVADGGFRRHEFWSDEGLAWLKTSRSIAPRYWRRLNGVWMERRFDRLVPLDNDLPITHVNWFEAEAYCRYAKRRLPTEAEWELAATAGAPSSGKSAFPWGGEAPSTARANLESRERAPVGAFASGDNAQGCRQLIGNVWEWTASPFAPYPGYVRDPYKEYSEPWFGTHKVLRGGSFATPLGLIRGTWRNFYLPHRADPFVGFRTCALDKD